MATFPLDRAKILALAQDIQTGMQQHADAFTGVPVTSSQLYSLTSSVQSNATSRKAAQDALDAIVLADRDGLAALAAAMQQIITFARSRQKQFPEILAWIDYDADAGPGELAPGLPRGFEIKSQTPATLTLDWKGPRLGKNTGDGEGGRVRFYEVVARKSAGEGWQSVATSTATEVAIPLAQLAGVFGHGVTVAMAARGVNNHGAGPESPSVAVMLP